MTDTLVMFNPAAAPGQKFISTAVRDEIGEVAPATIDPGSITEEMLAAGAVTEDKIGALAVTTGKLAGEAVTTAKLAANAVTTDKITNDSVTMAKAGLGVPTCTDNTGTAVNRVLVTLTAAQYAALNPKDPSTVYFTT